MTETNWAGNYAYGAGRIHEPRSVDELRHAVADAGQVRVLGSRHSFTDIVDAAELISLQHLPGDLVIDRGTMTVSIPGHFTYSQVCDALRPEGLALHNLASLPHISVGGAIATGTHGSGDTNGNLATAVRSLTIMRADGEIVTLNRGDADFLGAVVSLGALGIVMNLTLAVEPAFDVVQEVFENLPWHVAIDATDAVFSSGYSVSLFTSYGPMVEQVWVKQRADAARRFDRGFLGATPAATQRHMVPGESSVNCTPQQGERSLWSDGLPHFRADFTPSVGDEVQSEWFVTREHAGAAMQALRSCEAELALAMMVSEIRTVGADELWMSPHVERDSVAFHFTWFSDAAAIERVVRVVEQALAPFDPRPHWGKVFGSASQRVGDRYPRRDDFIALAERMDPEHKFRNDWFGRNISG